VPIPEKLQEALKNTRGTKDAFEKLTPSHRNEILAYLNYLRTPVALERNVKKVIDYLMEQRKNSSQ
jgi:uncharacterized protein YdeI (YjbR/CyaY-like superfamily)